MKLTDRDKQLVIWLPALVVIIGYFWLMASAPHARIKRLEQQISRAVEKAPRPLDLAGAEANIIQLKRDLAASEADAAKMKANLANLAGVSGNPIQANVAEKVAALLSQHHLVLVEQIPVAAQSATLPPALQRLAAQSQKSLGAGGAGFWQVKLTGNYADMADALDDLAGSDLRAIPAILNMAEGPQPATKLWTLVLWM
jgi:outer membrane protein TolC